MPTLEQVQSVVGRVYSEAISVNGFLDSLDLVELVMAVEDELDVDVDDYSLGKLREDTPVNEIAELIYKAIR